MRHFKILPVVAWFTFVLLFGMIAESNAGQDIRFSDGWKFNQGDATNAQQPSFSDNSWIAVCLPHTARVELNYKSSSYYLGVCWYRKTFTPSAAYQGKKIYLEFEGAMQTAQVYLNGTLLATHLGGYTPFVIDITKYLTFGAANVIAMRLDNNPSTNFPPSNTNPDFLYFGGLYRNAYLHIMDSLHITNALLANIAGGGGIFVTYPTVTTSSATVQVAMQVANEYTGAKSCAVTTTIVDSNGTTVASNSTTEQNLAAGASSAFTQNLSVSSPHLWHPATPYLYKLKTQVTSGAATVDTCTTVIGIRTIAFTHAGGFQINGQRLVFRGANRHQCYPYIGNAVPGSGQYRDVLRMKQYGFNFVRMSHYVQAQSFVDACDKLGVLGMACLPGWQYTSTAADFVNNSISDVRTMVRYYRNHPSVILYEVVHNESNDAESFCVSANSAAHQEYSGTQLYSCGENGSTSINVYSPTVQGSGRTLGASDSRPVFLSEYGDWDLGCVFGTPITGCQDRVVRSDGEAAMLRQAANHSSELSQNRALSWLAGDVLWSAYDYQTWANQPLTSSGSLDIFRIPKYSAWFFKSQRAPGDTLEPASAKGGPMVFIASQWTSSSASPITVFSNCDQVSLYLNNSLVSTQSPAAGTNLEHPKFSFTIPFQSGTLRADGLVGGSIRATHSVTTPGTATRVSVVIDTADLPFIADGSDIAIVYASIVDANNTVLPDASNVSFSIASGQGDLIGNNPQAAEAGIATVLLRSRTTAGQIVINASAGSLTSGSATVTAHSAPATGIGNPLPPAGQSLNEPMEIVRSGNTLIIRIPGIRGGVLSTASLILYNGQGRRMYRWSVTSAAVSIKVKELPPGLYMGEISRGTERYFQKVVVQ